MEEESLKQPLPALFFTSLSLVSEYGLPRVFNFGVLKLQLGRCVWPMLNTALTPLYYYYNTAGLESDRTGLLGAGDEPAKPAAAAASWPKRWMGTPSTQQQQQLVKSKRD